MFSAGLPGRELLKRAEARSDTVPPVSEVIPAEAEAFPALELLASSTLDTLARTPRQVVATSKGKGTLATTVSFSPARPITTFVGRESERMEDMEARALSAWLRVEFPPPPPARVPATLESAARALRVSLGEMDTETSAASAAI